MKKKQSTESYNRPSSGKVPLLGELKLKRSIRIGISAVMRRLRMIADSEAEFKEEKTDLKSELYIVMKHNSVKRLAITGCGSVRQQLVGERSSINEMKLRAVLLSVGVSATKINRIVKRSKITSEGKMSVVFNREREG